MIKKWTLFLLIFTYLLSGCSLMPVEETLPPVPVLRPNEEIEYELATVMYGDLILTESISCTYDLARKETLSFSVDGLIESIYVQPGQQVKSGDLIATLGQEEIRDQIQSLEYKKSMQLIEKRHLQEDLQVVLDQCTGAISQMEEQLLTLSASDQTQMLRLQIDDLRQKCADAQARHDSAVKTIDDAVAIFDLELEQLRDSLQYSALYASIDGIVTNLYSMETGKWYTKGRNFISISDPDSAVFIVNQKYADLFPVGMQVTVTCKNEEYSACVADRTELDFVNPDDQLVYLRLDNLDPTLKGRESGSISLTLDQREDVLYVNRNAVHASNGEYFVYMLDEDGLRTMRKVTVGLEVKEFVEIVDGLCEGDQVIME